MTSMLFSVIAGRGSMAQFSHPEFGGSGQWMAGGATTVSDMFNNAPAARVDALCNEMSALIRSEPGFAADPFQSQSQGANGNLQRRSSNSLATEGPDQSNCGPRILAFHLAPRSTERSSLRLFSRYPAPRHRYQWESDRLRHAGTSDWWIFAATAGIRLPEFLEPARRR